MATRDLATDPKPGLSVAGVPSNPNYSSALAVVTTLFFMWGFLTCLNDILVPHLKSIFDLSYARVMLIQFAFFSAYFIFSVPWSRIVNVIGYHRTMVIGLLTMAVGSFLFLPAASAASFPLFLTALLVLAAGITGLQVAANPYVTLLGRPETASSRLDLTQAFNSLGTTIAPKIGGLLILTGAPLAVDELQRLAPQALHVYRVQEAASVKVPYAVIGVALVLLAVLIGALLAQNRNREVSPRREDQRLNLEASESCFGCTRNLRVCGCRSVDRKLSSELFRSAGNRGSFRQVRGWLRLVLLGRSHGRSLSRCRTPAAVQAWKSAGAMRDSCGDACHCLHVTRRAHCDVDDSRCRVFQLHHVPNHLQFGSGRTWPSDRQRIGHSKHGHRRWRNPAGDAGCDCRPFGNSPRVLSAGDVLRVHLVLRAQRIEAEY